MKVNKVKGYRTMLGMTQTEMAEELGITPQAYYRKEKGLNEFKDSEKIKFRQMIKEIFPDITIEQIFFC